MKCFLKRVVPGELEDGQPSLARSFLEHETFRVMFLERSILEGVKGEMIS